MTITIAPSEPSSRRSGYSLWELIVTLSLSTLLFGAIFGAFVFVGRSSFGIANYSDMNNESRKGLEIFGRDVRAAESIHPGFSAREFTIDVPTNGGGGTEAVSYLYLPDDPGRPLVRRDSSGDLPIMTGVDSLDFHYYNLQAESANVPLEVKQIQLRLTLLRQTVTLNNTEKVVSARFILRNKKVGE